MGEQKKVGVHKKKGQAHKAWRLFRLDKGHYNNIKHMLF